MHSLHKVLFETKRKRERERVRESFQDINLDQKKTIFPLPEKN